MSEKYTPSIEMDPRRKPCVTIEFGSAGHRNEYLLVLRPGGIYGDASDIPGHWERVLMEKLGPEWNVMDRGTRLEIKPPPVDNGGFSEYIRTTETDRAVAEAFKSLLDETVDLKFLR
jgi:hypothetical protein